MPTGSSLQVMASFYYPTLLMSTFFTPSSPLICALHTQTNIIYFWIRYLRYSECNIYSSSPQTALANFSCISAPHIIICILISVLYGFLTFSTDIAQVSQLHYFLHTSYNPPSLSHSDQYPGIQNWLNLVTRTDARNGIQSQKLCS